MYVALALSNIRAKTNTLRSKCQGVNCNNVRSMTKQGNITSIIRTYKPKCMPGNNLGVVNQGNITYTMCSTISAYRAITYVSVCGTCAYRILKNLTHPHGNVKGMVGRVGDRSRKSLWPLRLRGRGLIKHDRT